MTMALRWQIPSCVFPIRGLLIKFDIRFSWLVWLDQRRDAAGMKAKLRKKFARRITNDDDKTEGEVGDTWSEII